MEILTGPKHGVKARFLVEFYYKYVRPKLKMAYKYMVCQGAIVRKYLTQSKIQPFGLPLEQGKHRQHNSAQWSRTPSILTRMKVQSLSYLQTVWISDNNPIKARIIKTGRILTNNPVGKRNKQYCIEFSLSLLREEEVRLNLKMALKVLTAIQSPPWTLKSLSGSTEFPAFIITHESPIFKRLSESLYKYHIQDSRMVQKTIRKSVRHVQYLVCKQVKSIASPYNFSSRVHCNSNCR